MLLTNWEKMNEDIWNSLDAFPSTPNDIYVDLLRFRLLEVGRPELERPENVEALNDEQKARDRFRSLGTPDTNNAVFRLSSNITGSCDNSETGYRTNTWPRSGHGSQVTTFGTK
jgi:hypothetical protein